MQQSKEYITKSVTHSEKKSMANVKTLYNIWNKHSWGQSHSISNFATKVDGDFETKFAPILTLNDILLILT